MEAVECEPLEKIPEEILLLLLQASSKLVSDVFNLAAPAQDVLRAMLDHGLHIPRAENLRVHIPLVFEDLPKGRVREAQGRPARKIDDHGPCNAVLQLPEEGCREAAGVVHKHKAVTKRQSCHHLCQIFYKVARSNRGESVLAQAPETQAPTFHLEFSGKPARDAAQAFVITRAGAKFWETDEEHVPTDRLHALRFPSFDRHASTQRRAIALFDPLPSAIPIYLVHRHRSLAFKQCVDVQAFDRVLKSVQVYLRKLKPITLLSSFGPDRKALQRRHSSLVLDKQLPARWSK
mmetsp:Transcript_41048/g.105946  ORF Transcript_41048/g.105946 Transcript_41048/m.105946 type:complete len:291 (-) Transcript_41048:712-1584(-)